MSQTSAARPTGAAPTCYRHPGRPAHIRCNRCDRPVCTDCMRDAAVGHQCVECVRAGAGTVRRPLGARSRLEGRRRSAAPVVTYALIGINVATFVVELAAGNLETQLTLWPPAVADGQFYRLVAAAFLHYGAMHLLFNMWALYIVGPPLEMWLGRMRFGALYALSGLGGSVLVYLLSPLNTATAGASGAIFGLFGATFVVGRRLALDVRWVVAIIVINLAFTFVLPAISSQRISWQGHLGGLVTGSLVAAAYVHPPKERRNMAQAGVTLIVAAALAALVWWRTTDLLAEFSR